MDPHAVIRARAHGPGTPPSAGAPLPEALATFLHRAYPSWDYRDTSAHLDLARGFPLQQVADQVAREITESCDVSRLFLPPGPPFLCSRIFFAAKRPAEPLSPAAPLQPKGGLFSRLASRPSRAPKAGAGLPGLGNVSICGLGPYACFVQPLNVLNPDFPNFREAQQLAAVTADVLARDGVELVPWDVLDIPILDMEGTPFGRERSMPTVYDCLFERLV